MIGKNKWVEKGVFAFLSLSLLFACMLTTCTMDDLEELWQEAWDQNHPYVAVTGIKLDTETLTIAKGRQTFLIAIVEPANATNKNVNWTSSNEKVDISPGGTVDSDDPEYVDHVTIKVDLTIDTTVTDKVEITATTEDGEFTITCTVTVVAAGGTVYLDVGSDPWLREGVTEITGLNPDKYYKVVAGTTRYVKADGALSTDLKDIGLASGGKITGLTNGTTYKVNAAVPFPGTLTYWNEAPVPSSKPTTTAKVDNNGVLALRSAPTGIIYSIDLNLIIDSKYEIMKVSSNSTMAPPIWTTWSASRCSGVYNNTLEPDPVPFDPDILLKEIGIYQWGALGSPNWINGMSVIYAPIDMSETEFVFIKIDGTTPADDLMYLKVKITP
jgi:hypothetical protein